MKDPHAENLRAELASLGDTLEEVLTSSSDKLDNLRTTAESALKGTRARLDEVSDKLAHQTRQVAGQADKYVRGNPWAGVAIGAVIGVVLGTLLTRR